MTSKGIERIVSNIVRKQEQDRTLEIGLTPIVAPFLALPGLIGFWPMSSVDLSSGDAYDISGQARRMTYTGNPTYNVYDSVTPYIDFDGTGDYLSLADSADLDIIGNEAIYAAAVRGLTMGGWFWLDSVTVVRVFMNKGDGATAAGSSYSIVSNSGTFEFDVYSGAAATAVTGGASATGAWYWIVGKYEPSVRTSIFVNGVKSVNVTSIPATINNTASPFNIGASNGLNLLDGRASMCFLSANALSDALITSLFNETRGYFGV